MCTECTHTYPQRILAPALGFRVWSKKHVMDWFSSVFHMRIYTHALFCLSLPHTHTGSEQRSSVQSMGHLCWAGLAVRLNKRADSWFAIAIHQPEKREEGKEWSSRSGLCLSQIRARICAAVSFHWKLVFFVCVCFFCAYACFYRHTRCCWCVNSGYCL